METAHRDMTGQLLDELPLALILIDAGDPALPVVYANRVYSATMQDSAPSADERAVIALAAATGRRVEGGVARQTGTGEHWFHLCVAPMKGRPSRLLATWTEAGQLHAAREQLEWLANHDPVTQLPNREALSQQLAAAIAFADGRPFALLHIAVREQNEACLPYEVREAFELEVARRLDRARASGDLLARYGGAEFAVLLSAPSDTPLATVACMQLAGALDEPVAVGNRLLAAECSIGIAFHPRDGQQPAQLIQHAQVALDAARAQGRGLYRFYAPTMSERALERNMLEGALRPALERGEFAVLYQPVADLRSGQLVAAEALLRWNHPALGVLAPDQFIALADDAGLSGALGAWVLARVLADLKRWDASGAAPLRAWINVTGRQLRDRTFESGIGAMLDAAGIGPARIAFEVREPVLVEESATTAQAVSRLRKLGIGLVLDDFGTGVSSLTHVKHFPIDLVKIDGSLTRAVAEDPRAAAMCQTIVAMAHALGIEVAAESVETEAQCDFLRVQMCDLVQGRLFSQPVDADAMEDLLRAAHSLPQNLLRIQRQQRTLLLVDDEPNILSALRRLLRRDGYHILAAGSAQEALELLARHQVDVIVSDQRMPGMLGSELLHMAKEMYPHTVRIMLSGYTELQSVTTAVNEGAIYKFLTKPWDDDLLRGHIADAFRMKEIADENERLNLQLRTAIHELATTNRKMAQLLQEKQ